MLRPITALLWEISRRRRGAIIALASIILFETGFKFMLSEKFLASTSGKDFFQNVSGFLMALSVLTLLEIFNFTESTPEKDWTGFPYRLFVLPLPTLLLVAIPMISGIIALSLVFAFWNNFIFTNPAMVEPHWIELLLISFLLFFQTIIWCLAGFRIGRLLVFGLAGPLYILVGFLPWIPFSHSVWFSTKRLTPLLFAQIILMFALSWICVSRQRCGGGRRTNLLRTIIDSVGDCLPERKGDFASAAGAQFWFEWRRAGMILPACIAGILLFFIYPLSLHYRSDGPNTLRILLETLATPILLAALIGKGFSKPDFWSNELSYPPFNAVRPLSNGETIVVKLKVAALSAAISWAMIILFLCFWLPGWADLDSLNLLRIGFWMAYDHSVLGQNLIAVLIVMAGIFMTWKCLVDGLWTGLSGSWKKFLALPVTFVFFTILGIIALTIMLNHDDAVKKWYRADPDRVLSWLQEIAALAVIIKFLLAARAWRDISSERVRKYLLLWFVAMLCLLGLAILLWADGLFELALTGLFGILPWDANRLFALMLLLALLGVPIGRIALARSSLARNRHQI